MKKLAGNSTNKKKSSSASARKLNIRKLVISAIVAVVAVYFVYILIWQQVTINQKSAEIDTLKQQVTSVAEESERLKQEVENLNDPEYLERVAREKLGLVRPNERVFVDSNKSDDNDNR